MYLLNLINITSFNGTRSTLKLMPTTHKPKQDSKVIYLVLQAIFVHFFLNLYLYRWLVVGWVEFL